MIQKGAFDIFWPLMNNSLFADHAIEHAEVRIGITATLAMDCHNANSFTAHAYLLNQIGYNTDEIQALVQDLKFPDRVADTHKWNAVLRWIHFFERNASDQAPQIKAHSQFIHTLVSEEQYNHLYRICAFTNVINHFNEYFLNEITTLNCELFTTNPGYLNLTTNFEKLFTHLKTARKAKSLTPHIICPHCNNIKNYLGKWQDLETLLPLLDRDSTFEVDLCPDCYADKHRSVA